MTRTDLACIIVAALVAVTTAHLAYAAMHTHNAARLEQGV